VNDEVAQPVAGAVVAPATGGSSVSVTRLMHEAANRSGMLWIRIPGGRAHPVWHVWHDDGDARGAGSSVYVVSGAGEQYLPRLPREVELVLRSKDSGGRLLTVRASARELDPGSAGWAAAVAVLRPERLNATGDVTTRWREECAIHVITPHGRLVEGPGRYDEGSGAEPVRPAAEATAARRPWHWRGRARARRNRAG
jgi:hypothetical protein